MADAFPLSGQVDPQAFPFLLMALNRQGATGSLKVAGPSYQKALYFRGGRILFASSNDPRDQLGAILLESGVLTPEQLEDANSKVGQGSPLAKVLADTGFVSQRELSEAARSKVERILSDVIAYDTGSFEFEDGVLPKGAVDLKLATERLMLSAVRRVRDRAFVLRYLSGLDVVLKQAPEMSGRLPEVEAETGELLAQINGQKTLKEAAAATHLEEFEAAKMACALLFLGVLARDGQPGGSPAADESDFPAFVLPDGGEIDLSETAREALGARAGSGRSKTPPRPAAAESEQPFFTEASAPSRSTAPPPAPPGPEAAEEPTTPPGESTPRPPRNGLRAPTPPVAAEAAPTPSSSPAKPLPLIPPPSGPETTAKSGPEASGNPGAAASGKSGPEVSSQTVAVAASGKSVAGEASSKGAAAEAPGKSAAAEASSKPAVLPSLPPNWRPSTGGAGPARAASTGEDAPPPSLPPSKDDLAALDALLNSRGIEGPLEPLERKAPEAQRWSPQFGAHARAGRRTPARSGTIVVRIAGILGLSALAVAGAWYMQRERARPVNVSASTPSTAPSRAPSTLAPEGVPSVLPTSIAAPSAAPPLASPRAVAGGPPVSPASGGPTPVPASPAPMAQGEGPGLEQARRLMNRGEFDAAARDFASTVRRAPAGTLSIQLLVACSADTVQKAVSSAGSPELYILPVNFKGRDCYRLCWGLYPTEARAQVGLSAVPDYFRRNGATPRVTVAGQLLP